MSIYEKNGKFYCRFQLNGERHHYKCNGATSIKEAQKIENQYIYKVQQQQNGVLPRDEERVSLTKFYQCYEDYAKLNKKTWQEDINRLNIIKYIWKNKKYAVDIKNQDIEELKKALLLRGISKITANRYLEILSKMFNLGIDNGWLAVNPIKKTSKFTAKNYQIRYLSKDEEVSLFKVASAIWQDIIFVELQTGLRQTNIRLLQGKNIKLDFRIIEITENKGNKHIKLPMTEKLYNFFKDKNLKSDDYVFLNPKTNKPYDKQVFQREWVALVKKAKIEPIRFHDLRHTVGTRLAEIGIPINVIREYMAHSDIKTTMQYVHTASYQLQKAAELFNSYN